MNPANRSCNIFVAAYACSDNVGDNAIFESLIHECAARHEYLVVSVLDFGMPEAIFFPENVTVNHIRPKNVLSILGAIYKSDKVIMGGGGIIQQNSSVYNLYYFLAIGWFSLLLKRRLEIRNIGVGTVSSRIGRKFLPGMIERACSVSVRDEDSKKRLLELRGGAREVSVVKDMAFDRPYWPFRVSQHVFDLAGDKFLLLALRPPMETMSLVSARKKYNPERLKRLARSQAPFLQSVIDEILSSVAIRRVIFFPSQFPRDRDYAIELLHLLDVPEPMILESTCTFDDLLLLATRSRGVLASRYHACIAAIRAKTTLIAIRNFKIKTLIEAESSVDNALLLPNNIGVVDSEIALQIKKLFSEP